MIVEKNIDDFLVHHGVKGQKWGIRKQGRVGNSAHQDNILNYLYRKMGKLYEQNKLDDAMLLMDRILERRVKIKELPKSALGGSNKNNVKKKRIVKGVAIGGAIAATALVSAVLSRQGMVPVSQLRAKEYQIAKIRYSVDKAMFQNPVRRNQEASVRAFVKKLDMSG